MRTVLNRLALTAVIAGFTLHLTAADAREGRLPALAKLVHDTSPKVRLEALRALAKIPSAKSAELALSVLDQPMDPTLDYALWLTINDLSGPWIAALQSGAWKTEGRERQLEFGLRAIRPEQASLVLGQLLAKNPLGRDGKGPWIELIGSAGTQKELRALFDQVVAGGFDQAASARALRALTDATRLRKLKPDGSTVEVGRLFTAPSESVRIAALGLAAVWKDLGPYFPKLGELAGDPATSAAVRTAVFGTLRAIGGKGAVETFLALSKADGDSGVRRQAVAALASLDLGKAVPAIVDIAKLLPDETQAQDFWRAVLPLKGAGKAIAEALPAEGISPSAAKAGMRVAREGGRNDMDLVVALAKASGLAADTQAFTGALIKELAAKAAAQGDPHRGELIFRRADLACVSCHAIGGAGGKVGPDLTSIGASAQMDYLVESVLLPNAKIKEGYHSVVVTTKDGTEYTGTLARETPQEIVLRNAAGAEQAVPKADVVKREQGALSLMPSGLMDPLTEPEQLDLFAFLSRLGKPGEFDASKGGVARKWRLYPQTHTDQQNGQGNVMWDSPLDAPLWHPVYALVSGRLTRPVMDAATRLDIWSSTLAIFAATELQTAQAGPVKFRLLAEGAELWVDGRKIGGPGESSAQLPAGTHRVLVKLNPKLIPEAIRLESDASFVLN